MIQEMNNATPVKFRTEIYERFFNQESYIALILTTILLAIVSFVGVIGNYFVIIVFSKHVKHAVSNLLITSLAIIDLIICLVDIPMTLYWVVWQYKSIDILCKLHVILKAFCIPVSAFILVMIAIDRFLIICFIPSIIIQRNTAAILLFIVFLIGIILSIPVGLHTGIMNYFEIPNNDILMSSLLNVSNQTLNFPNDFRGKIDHIKKKNILRWGSCSRDQRYINKRNYMYYNMSLFALFTFLMVLIIVFYSIIFIFLWTKHRKMKTYETRNHKKPQKEFSLTVTSNLLRLKSFHKRRSLQQHSVDMDDPTISCSSNIKRQHSHKRRKPHVRTAYALALIAATFIISYLPYLLISNEFMLSIEKRSRFSNKPVTERYWLYLRHMLFYFYFFNSAINPIIYSVTNNQFKSDIKKMEIVKCFTRMFNQ